MPFRSRFYPALLLTAALAATASGAQPAGGRASIASAGSAASADASNSANAPASAVFAGGSFWCLEAAFEALPGVDSAQSGYTGGRGSGESGPAFDSVASGTTGFVEAVRVFYHPRRITYAKLLDAFWRNIDPTRADGQFSDAGPQYRTVIYYGNAAERSAATASLIRLRKSARFAKPVVTEISPALAFYPAEPEHQDYYKKNQARYRTYVRFSGRAAFFQKAWGIVPPASPGARFRTPGPGKPAP